MKKILITFLLLMAVLMFTLIFSSCNDATDITSVDELNVSGIIIGVQNSTTGHTFAIGEFSNAQINAYAHFTDAVTALLVGTIDAVIVDTLAGEQFVAANSDRLMLLDDVLTAEQYGISFALGSRLTAMFNEAFDELRENGTFQAIYDYWISEVPGASRYVSPPGTTHPNGVLRMGTNPGFPPFEMYEGGHIVGFDPCMARAIGDILGYEIEIVDMEFAAIIPAVQAGTVDFGMAGMTITEERRESVDFSQGYFYAGQRVLVRIPGAELEEGEAPPLYGEEGTNEDEEYEADEEDE